MRSYPAPLKIALICNYEPDRQYSMLRYAEMLERLMKGAGHSVERIFPPVVFGRIPLQRGTPAKWIGYLDKYVLGIPWLRWKCRGANLVHVCDHSNAMYLWCAGSKPRLITCHDLLAVRAAQGDFPGVLVRRTGKLQQRWILNSLRQAEFIVCDSLNTEADVRALGCDAAATRVVYLSLNRQYFPVAQEKIESVLVRFGLPADCRYLLHIGGNEWYKNRRGALQIFSSLKRRAEFADVRLIMAGRAWTEELRELRRSARLEDSVIETGALSDDELRALYSGALALLFPSLQEGFGWPILEAQACGCPVITTNRRPMTEVAGDAAILIDDPAEFEQAASAIIERWPDLAGLREAGFRNLERFSEAAMTAACCGIYEEVRERFSVSEARNLSRV